MKRRAFLAGVAALGTASSAAADPGAAGPATADTSGVAHTSADSRGVTTAATADEADCEDVVQYVPQDVQASGTQRDSVVQERPRPWHEHVERVQGVVADLRAEYGDEPWYASTGTRPAEDGEICGRTEYVVYLRTTDAEAARSAVGEDRDGVPIVVDEVEPLDPDGRLPVADDTAGIGLVLGLAAIGTALSRRSRSE